MEPLSYRVVKKTAGQWQLLCAGINLAFSNVANMPSNRAMIGAAANVLREAPFQTRDAED
jgi:hypothetical protein